MLASCLSAGEDEIRRLLAARGPVVELPAGTIEIRSELMVPGGVEIRGHRAGTILRAASAFRGRGLVVVDGASQVRLRHLTFDGNRPALESPLGIAPSNTAFADFYRNNGVWVRRAQTLVVSDVTFHNIANFAILASESRDVRVERVRVTSSGSRNEKGRNNTTGGILFEEGTAGFSVTDSVFRNVRGNGVWTHSRFQSPRNSDGRIARNHFEQVGRDAIQVGHATGVVVENNTGVRIGYPLRVVDVENEATPVAVDTAGIVDHTVYTRNRFAEINGKCIDLDGFHHGEVRDNVCVNQLGPDAYPNGHFGIVFNDSHPDVRSEQIVITGNHIEGAKFGGLFLIGEANHIEGNRFLNVNTAGCNESGDRYGCLYLEREPDLLQSGIYLGRGVAKVSIARRNVIRGNVVTGHRMAERCIGLAPGVKVDENTVEGNECRN